jgi:hypothetical protein
MPDQTTLQKDAEKSPEKDAGNDSAPSAPVSPYEGFVTVIVKKRFIFTGSIPIEGADGVIRYVQDERVFQPGTYMLNPNDPKDASFLNHSWYRNGYCDGHVESPDETHARATAEEEKAVLARAAADNAIAQAQAAQAMAKASSAKGQLNEEEIQKELNTPMNVLRRGAKIPGTGKAK